jgi:hypothetical protein
MERAIKEARIEAISCFWILAKKESPPAEAGGSQVLIKQQILRSRN